MCEGGFEGVVWGGEGRIEAVLPDGRTSGCPSVDVRGVVAGVREAGSRGVWEGGNEGAGGCVEGRGCAEGGVVGVR